MTSYINKHLYISKELCSNSQIFKVYQTMQLVVNCVILFDNFPLFRVCKWWLDTIITCNTTITIKVKNTRELINSKDPLGLETSKIKKYATQKARSLVHYSDYNVDHLYYDAIPAYLKNLSNNAGSDECTTQSPDENQVNKLTTFKNISSTLILQALFH